MIGHQWYWKYEYSDFVDVGNKSFGYESYLMPIEDMPRGGFRVLEADTRLLLPINTHVRVLVTSGDVLHSWAIPSFGIKVDAIPGRLSQASVFVKRLGVFYGQCSEICGTNHGFMPCVVRSIDKDEFTSWVSVKLDE